MRSVNWSKEELNILKYVYGYTSKRKLEEHLPKRNYQAIKLKASRIGLTNSRHNYRLIDDPKYYSTKLAGTNIINLEKYQGSKISINHKCLTCAHEWYTSPNSIYLGSGCPNCNRGGGHCNNNAIGYLYLLHINTGIEEFLKIGVTVLDNSKRIKQLKTDISVHRPNIKITELKKLKLTGQEADQLELKIIKLFPRYSVPYEFSGYTELISTEYLNHIMELLNEKH